MWSPAESKDDTSPKGTSRIVDTQDSRPSSENVQDLLSVTRESHTFHIIRQRLVYDVVAWPWSHRRLWLFLMRLSLPLAQLTACVNLCVKLL